MAQLIGGLATSHIPAIGGAIHKGLQNEPYWKPFFDGFPPTAHPMAILSAMINAASSYHPNIINKREERFPWHAARLISQVRTIAAYSYRKAHGLPTIYPKTTLKYTANFLHMMFSLPNEDWPINEDIVRALDAAKNSGKFEYALDLGTAWTGEWYPYAFSPFLQSFGGDIVDRSTYKTAEGALSKVGDALQRMRELAVQGANGVNQTGDLTNLDAEYQQLVAEVTRLGTSTRFNGAAVFSKGGRGGKAAERARSAPGERNGSWLGAQWIGAGGRGRQRHADLRLRLARQLADDGRSHRAGRGQTQQRIGLVCLGVGLGRVVPARQRRTQRVRCGGPPGPAAEQRRARCPEPATGGRCPG
mgnify:CR=1 FL=1